MTRISNSFVLLAALAGCADDPSIDGAPPEWDDAATTAADCDSECALDKDADWAPEPEHTVRAAADPHEALQGRFDGSWHGFADCDYGGFEVHMTVESDWEGVSALVATGDVLSAVHGEVHGHTMAMAQDRPGGIPLEVVATMHPRGDVLELDLFRGDSSCFALMRPVSEGKP